MKTPTAGLASRLLLVTIGAHGLVVQLVLIRELMASSGGNELTAGAVLAVWIAAEAGGAWLLGRAGASRVERLTAAAVPLAVVASIAAIPAAAIVQVLLGVLPGELLSVPVFAAVAAIVVFLPAFTHGGLFVLGTIRHAQDVRPDEALGLGYVWEGIGTVGAALVVWLLLLSRVGPVALVAASGVPMLLATMFLGRRPWPGAAALVVATGVAVAAAVMSADIEKWGLERRWTGQRVVSLRSSPYGKVIRLERQGQQTVLYDGAPVFTEPEADPVFADELAQLALLAHPAPRRVVVLGAGAGVLLSVLRHHVARVDWVVQDPVLQSELAFAAGPALAGTFDDGRFRSVVQDPRRFLEETDGRFDCIIVTDPVAFSLGANRLFTVEFFELCRKRLTDDGVLTMPAPGTVTAPARETRAILATRLRTLSEAFPVVVPVAVDFPLFVASGQAVVLHPDTLAARLAKLGPGGAVVNADYLAQLLDHFRQEQYRQAIAEDQSGKVNRDFTPHELLQNMIRESSRASPALAGIYSRVAGVRAWHLVAIGLLLAVLLVSVRAGARPSEWSTRVRGVVSVGATGCAGAGLVTAAIPVYQVRFGAVYSAVGLIMAAFMAGTVLGGWLGTRAGSAGRQPHILFLASELAVAIGALSALALVRVGSGMLFAAVVALAGGAVGFQFPVAGALLAVPSPAGRAVPVGHRAGLVTAADLVGGVLGAVLAALLLVPALGFGTAVVAFVGLKLITAAAWVGRGAFDISGSPV